MSGGKGKRRSAHRRAVLARDDGCCWICGERSLFRDGESAHQVHHVFGRAHFPECSYDVDNGVTLCPKHHKGVELAIYNALPIFLGLLIGEPGRFAWMALLPREVRKVKMRSHGKGRKPRPRVKPLPSPAWLLD
jgi:5-methylcytosine-specific restriction endonuclease McrA